MQHVMARLGCAGLVCAGALSFGSGARAEEANYFERGVPAPSHALELKVGTSYTQGFGMIAPGRSIRDTAGAGIGVDLDADYRANPTWSVGVQGEYQEFANELNTAARGMAANVGVTFHAMPYSRGDAWLRLGTGYRLLWSVNPPGEPNALRHGFELAKATIGYDVRVSSDVALSPVVGADLNLFVWEDQNGANRTLASAQVGTFIFAGLQGRFDIGGQSGAATTVATNRDY
jgi:hypothetical protein